MNNQQPGITFAPGASGGGPTPAPIHDIVGPLPFFSGPLWVIVAAFLFVAIVGGLVWWFFIRKKTVPPTPRESALAALVALRDKVHEGNDHDFGVGVSDVLRRFLGDAFGLAAPRQTTEEFLQSLHQSLRFVATEQESLAGFLSHADHLKYAQGAATLEQRLALIEAAESFVQSGEREAGESLSPKDEIKEGA